MSATERPRLLDLYCGAGGAGKGYHDAGFEVVGVDHRPQPRYPYEFIEADALEFLDAGGGRGFDAIHASPPCQKWTAGAKANGNEHDDLVTPTLQRLSTRAEWPYVLENVRGAPIRHDLMLCGSMFSLQVQRHRYFEIAGFLVPQPSCCHIWEQGRPYTVTGHADGEHGYRRKKYLGFVDLAHAQRLMQMPWAGTLREVTEAIPPAYTRYIGEALLDCLDKHRRQAAVGGHQGGAHALG